MNKNLSLVLVLSLIFLAGCQGNNNNNSSSTFLGGIDGLGVSFKELAPKTSFQKDELVDFALVLENNGEFDIPQGTIYTKLDGVNFNDWDSLNGEWRLVSQGINGVSKDFPEPQQTEVSYGKSKFIGEILGSRPVTFGAKTCYPYVTTADIPVCISSKRVEDNSQDSVCDIDGEKVSSGSVSRAPVQLTSLQESFLGSDSLKFDLTLENKGAGTIVDKDVKCGEEQLSDKGIVYIKLPEGYICTFPTGERSNEGKVSLQTGSRVLRCETPVTSSFEDRLIITLEYKYQSSGSVTVNVNPAT